LAALSAAFLVSILRSNVLRGSGEGEVVVAITDLPAMQVLDSSHVRLEKIPKEQLPLGFLTSKTTVINRVLSVDIKKGQVITRRDFVTSGTEAELAATLKDGMRAVSITLPKESASGGLLYPGCVVDILASFRLSGAFRDKGEALSTTLLHGIKVLAVEKKTIVSGDEDIQEKTAPTRTASKVTVTLLVDTRQAEALQLAQRYGDIYLAMRNPLDKSPVDIDPTVLSEGQLARMGSTLDTAVAVTQNEMGQMIVIGPDGLPLIIDDSNDINNSDYQQISSTGQSQDLSNFLSGGIRSSKPWLVTVIRGKEVKDEELQPSETEE
jgi:Flp pilus assembly protein CpaB